MRTGLRASAALMLAVGWPASAAEADAVRPYKPCHVLLGERGLSPGPEWNAALGPCLAQEASDIRAGIYGIEMQARTVCDEQVRRRGHTPGYGLYKQALAQCVDNHKAVASGTTPAGQDTPFGTGRVAAYMNAIHAGDFVAMSEIADDFQRRVASKFTSLPPQMRSAMSLMPLIWQNYLASYPHPYRSCLEPGAPEVTVGVAYDEVRTNGLGIELGRVRVDHRQQVPVNRRFYRVAQRVGAQGGTAGDDMLMRLLGYDFGEFSYGRVGAAVQQAMRRHACDGPVVQQFEAQLLKLGATARERGEAR